MLGFCQEQVPLGELLCLQLTALRQDLGLIVLNLSVNHVTSERGAVCLSGPEVPER